MATLKIIFKTFENDKHQYSILLKVVKFSFGLLTFANATVERVFFPNE